MFVYGRQGTQFVISTPLISSLWRSYQQEAEFASGLRLCVSVAVQFVCWIESVDINCRYFIGVVLLYIKFVNSFQRHFSHIWPEWKIKKNLVELQLVSLQKIRRDGNIFVWMPVNSISSKTIDFNYMNLGTQICTNWNKN